MKETSIRGPVDIQPGQTKTFVIDFEIAADAPEGSFDAVIKPTATYSNIEPELHTQDTQVSFTIDRRRPFLQSVSVANGEGGYVRSWACTELTCTLSAPARGLLVKDGDEGTVTLTFSEPVKGLSLVVEGPPGGQSLGAITLTSAQTEGAQTVFTGTLRVPADGTAHGLHTMVVGATDLAGVELLALVSGDKTFDVKGRLENLTQGDGLDRSMTFNLDRGAPEAKILDPETFSDLTHGTTKRRKVLVQADDSEQGSGIETIELRLAPGGMIEEYYFYEEPRAIRTALAPRDAGVLETGRHEATAADRAGNSTTTWVAVEQDLAPPWAAVYAADGKAIAGSATKGAVISVLFDDGIDGSGVSRIVLMSPAHSETAHPGDRTVGSVIFPLEGGSLPEGDYTVIAYDAWDNPSPAIMFIVDRTVPILTAWDSAGVKIISGDYRKSPSVDVRVDDSGSPVTGLRAGACQDLTVQGSRTYLYTLQNLACLGSLPAGRMTLVGLDQAGNESAPLSYTVDLVPPSSQVTFPLAGSYESAALGEFRVSGTAGDDNTVGRVNVYIDGPSGRWDGAKWGPGEGPILASVQDGAWSVAFPIPEHRGLGDYYYYSEAVDLAGNVEPPHDGVAVRVTGPGPAPFGIALTGGGYYSSFPGVPEGKYAIPGVSPAEGYVVCGLGAAAVYRGAPEAWVEVSVNGGQWLKADVSGGKWNLPIPHPKVGESLDVSARMVGKYTPDYGTPEAPGPDPEPCLGEVRAGVWMLASDVGQFYISHLTFVYDDAPPKAAPSAPIGEGPISRIYGVAGDEGVGLAGVWVKVVDEENHRYWSAVEGRWKEEGPESGFFQAAGQELWSVDLLGTLIQPGIQHTILAKAMDLAGNVSGTVSMGTKRPYQLYESGRDVSYLDAGGAGPELSLDPPSGEYYQLGSVPLARSVREAAAQTGLASLGALYYLGPAGQRLEPAAELLMRYGPSPAADPAIYAYERAGGAISRLAGQTHSTLGRELRADIDGLGYVYGVFGLPPPASVLLVSTPTIAESPEFTLLTNDPSLFLVEVDTTDAFTGAGSVLASWANMGYEHIGGVYAVRVEDELLVPAGEAVFRYSAAAVVEKGVVEATLALRRLDGEPIEPTQTLDLGGLIRAQLRYTGMYALMGSTRPLPPDVLPPETALSFAGPIYAEGVNLRVSTRSGLVLSPSDPPMAGAAVSGVESTFYVVLAATSPLPAALNDDTSSQFMVLQGTPTLPEGRWLLVYGSRDRAGNYEPLRSAVVLVDGAAPDSRLLIDEAGTALEVGLFVSTKALLSIVSEDPPSEGASSNQVRSFMVLDRDPRTDCGFADAAAPPVASTEAAPGSCLNPAYAGAFRLAEGTHTAHHLSVDLLGNADPWQVHSLTVDATPPATELSVSGDWAMGADGRLQLSAGARIALSAADPTVRGAAAGLAGTYFLVNRTAEQCGFGTGADPVFDPAAVPGSCSNPVYSGPFELFDGTHTLGYFSLDRFRNSEALHTIEVVVRGNPPAVFAAAFGSPGSGPGNFDGPFGTAVSPRGNYLYVADAGNHRVQRFSRDGRLLSSFGSRGSGRGEFGEDGPVALAATGFEGVVVADPGNSRVQIFDANGTFLHEIGGFSAFSVAVDTAAGRVFILDIADRVVKKYSMKGEPLGSMGSLQLIAPRALALSRAGVFVLDGGDNKIKRFRQGGLAAEWELGFPGALGLHAGPDGYLYVTGPDAVRVFDEEGRMRGVIGSAGAGPLGFASPRGMASDAAGRLYIADTGNDRIQILRKSSSDMTPPAAVTLALAAVSPYSARLSFADAGDDGGSGRAALYELRSSRSPIYDEAAFADAEPLFVGKSPGAAGGQRKLSVDGLAPGTTYYFALRSVDDAGNASALAAVQAWTPERVPVGVLSRFAGLEKGVQQWAEPGPPTLNLLTRPVGLALDASGTLYVGSSGLEGAVRSDRVLAIGATGIMAPFAGSFLQGSSPDGVPAVEARLGGPIGVAATSARLLIAETSNSALRKVEGGILWSIPAQVLSPMLMAADAEGDVLIADSGHHRILRMDGLTGGMTPVAGSGTAGNDNAGQALAARLNSPGGVAFSPDGGFLVADTLNHRVAKVRDGYLTTAAGIGSAGYFGDGGPAASAALNAPMGLAVDPLGAFYIAESAAHVVRKVDVAGVITTLAGVGVAGDSGADGPAAQARLDKPMGLALDSERGLLFVADMNNDRVAAVGIDRFMSVASSRLFGGTPELVAVSTGTLSLTEASVGGEAAAAAGLRLLTAVYDIAAGVIPGTEVPQSRLNFSFDPSGMEPGTIAVFHFDGATWSSATVALQRLDLSTGTGRAGGTVLAAGRWAVLGRPLDIMPPRTAFRHGEPSYGSGPLYVASTTLLGFYAEDDLLAVGDKAGRGVERTYYGLDGGELDALGVYSSSFSLSTESVHDVRFYSMDRSGNHEDVQVSSVAVDVTPPRTVPVIEGPWLERTEGIYAAGISTMSLIAADRISSGTPVGFRRTLLTVDGVGAISLSAMTPLSLAEGPHELSWHSEDLLGNAEVLASTHLVVDASPPAVSALSPAGGETFFAGKDTITVSFAVGDSYDSAPSSAAVLVHTSGSSVTVANGQTIDPASLLDGFWELRVSAVDFVQNSTVVVSGKFEVMRDNLPPRTSLVLGQPSVSGDPAWVKSATLLTLEVKDDAVAVGDERGLGVARSTYSVDGGAWLEYSNAGFHLSGEGPHDVAYRSVDVLGHVEEVKVSSVSVDETPPSIAFTQPAANAILNTNTPTLLLSYSDTGSGIDPSTFTIGIDGVDLSLQASANGSGASLIPPSVGQGSHTVTASIADRLGNTRSVSLSFFVDSIAPQAAMTKPLGTYVNSKRPTMEGIASDYGSGLNTSSITMRLDGSSVPAQVTGAGGGDGAPGPWLEAATLPTGLLAMASVVSDGMLYVSGGYDAGHSGFSKAVRYASIGPGGVLGDWQAGPILLQGVRGHKMVAADGNLIVLGGYVAETNSTTRDVLVAPINAINGSLGSWVKSNFQLPFIYGEQNFAATVVNGYLYVMGGENNPYGQVSSKVYFTKLCPSAGLCEGWTETTPLPGPLDQIVAVTVGGTLFLYVPGGTPTGSAGIRQVLYNKPDPARGPGHLGTWRYTTEMPRAVTNYAAVGAEGHIYVLGGTPLHEPVKTVDFAAVNPDGTVGAWTEDPRYDLPKALSSFSAVAWDGRIFVVGGQKGPAEGWGMSDKVYSSVVRSDVPVVMATATYVPMADLAEGDHTVELSAADKAGNLGQAPANVFKVDSIAPSLAATAAGKSLGADEPWVKTARPEFVLSYADSGSGIESASLAIALDGVEVTAAAQPNSASFTPQADLAQGPHTLMASISDRAGNIASISVQFKVDSILPQVAISTPANGVYFTTSTVTMAAVYGDGGSGLSTATVALVLNSSQVPAGLDYAGGGSGRGIPGPWTAAGTLPATLWGHASAVWGNTAYVLGGSGPNVPNYSPLVWHKTFDANGSLSDWTSDTPMPRGYMGHGVVAAQNRLFIIGGQTSANVTYNSVYVATLAAGGGLVPGDGWHASYDLSYPAGTTSMGVVEVDGYLYVVGGNNPNCQVHAQVYYAKICPEKPQGLCGPWTATASLNKPLDQLQVVAVNGMVYVYALGGITGGCSNTPTNEVWYTRPDPNKTGALQAWSSTVGLPRMVRRHVGLGAQGHIYVLGGSPSLDPVATVNFAEVNAQDGQLEAWSVDPQYNLPEPLLGASGLVWNDRLYVLGGANASWTVSNKIYASPVGTGLVASATATYTGTLAQDHYVLSAVTEDLAANSSTASVSFAVDWTPPTSSLMVEGVSRSFEGRLYVQGQPPLRIAVDDAVSGVKERRLQVDAAALAVTEGTFTLTQGNHELEFYSVDRAGNVESTKTASIKLDGMAPAAVADLVAVVPSTTGMTLTWTSPGDDGAGGTIRSGELRVQYASFAATFSTGQAQIVEAIGDQEPGTYRSLRIEGLTPGSDYTFALWTKDTAGNYSAAATASARTLSLAQSEDQVASIISPEPLLTVSTVTPAAAAGPLSVSTTQGLGTLTPTFYELTTGSTEPVHFSTPAVLSFIFDRTGVDLDRVAIYKYMDEDGDGDMEWSSAPIVNQTLTMVDGGPYWQITGQIYSASLYSVFEKRDILPPRTTLALGEPKYVAGETYLTAVTDLSLSAVDDRSVVGDGDGVGVSGTQYALDGGAAALYTAPVRLSGEGPHDFAFFSVDLKNNLEARQNRRLVVDGMPPQTTVSLSTPSFEAFVSPLTTVKLSAQDPPSGAVPGSGFNKLLYAIGAAQLAQGPLEFGLTGPDGKYELSYQAQDNLGNLETLQKKTYSLDSTPAVSVADIGAHSYSAPDGKKYVSPLTPVTLSAQDQTVNEVASGVQFIAVDLGQGYATYTAPLTFAAGQHQIQYRATDKVGNMEPAKALELYVDGTAPATLLSYDGYHLARTETTLPPAEAEMFILPETKLILTAQDPGEIASGVGATEYRLDEGAWVPYSAPFSITADGLHTLAWRSKDRVDNEETVHSLKIAVIGDILPPRTAMQVGEPKYIASHDYVTSRTELILSAIDDRLTLGDGLGVGVDRTEYSVDEGASTRYSAPVKLSGEGPHAVGFFSVDLLGHVETTQSQSLTVDDAPPATLVSLSTPAFGAYVSPLTTVKLSAQDPTSGAVPGSGLAKLLYAVGSGPLAEGVLEFGLKGADGKYELNYQAQDNLGNLEPIQKSEYSLDSTPPLSAYVLGSPSYVAPDGKKYVSPLTPVTLSAQDPAINEVASGLKLIEVDLGQGFAAYQNPLNFAEGRREPRFRSLDNVGNMEPAKALELYVDGTAPATLLSYDGYHLPRAETSLPPPEAEMFVLPETKLILTAQDPGELASGVGVTEYRLDEGAWLAYSAPFSIAAEGLHTLAWRSRDRVANEEVFHSLKIAVINDILPPRTAMQVGEPKYIASRSYVTSRTELTLSAIDDRLSIGDGLGLGVDRTVYSVDGGASARYSAPVKLAGEGPHVVAFFSVDTKNNVEAGQDRTLAVDDAPPQTTVALSTPSFGAYVSPLTVIKLTAQDPASGSVPGSGLAKLLYAVGSGPLAEGVLEFGLKGADGKYELNYQAQDNLGNLEPLQKSEYSLDGTPPLSAYVLGSPSYIAPDGKKYVSPLTSVALSAQDPAINEVASGLKLIEVDLGQGFAAYQGPLSFAEGRREPRFRSLDNVGNMEVAKSLELYSDGTTPITAISYDGYHLSRAETVLPPPEAEMFILPETKLILTAQDPGEMASGVGATEYRLDEGAWLAYSAPFSITAEGLHTLAWRSRDRVANEEVFHSLKIAVINDILPPRTAMEVGEPKYIASRHYLTSRTELTLSAIDDRLSIGDGVGLGVDRTEYSVDGGASARYSAPVKLAGEGPHVVAFFSVDTKNNVEAGQDRTLAVDDAPPQTAVALSTPSFGAYVSPLTVIRLTAQDPPSGTVPGSGLNKLLYAIGAGQLAQGTLEFGLTGPDGKYELSYQAQDNLGNLETLQKKTYSLDSTPPLSASAMGAHSYQAPDGKLYVSPVSQVALSATDPLVNEVASGIKLMEADLGQGYAPYTAPLTFAPGQRQFQYRATDNVGNVESAKALEIYVDGVVPVTAISYDGFHLTRANNPGLPPPEAEEFISPQTKIVLTAQDPGTDTVSGVKLTEYRLDEGAWVAYSVPFSITTEGLHTLAWRSKDQVDNEETVHSVKLGVMGDIQPPRTVMSIGTPKYVAADTYLTSQTELTLTAVDDRLSVGDGLGLGVERTEYSVDAGVLARYTAPIKLSGNGPHNVAFFSTDVLGHAEASQARRLLVDDAPPITEIVLSGLRFTAQSGDPYAVGGPLFIASTTLTALQAQDPLVNGSASGLASLSYGLDTTALGPYSGAFTVAAQGAHALKYLAVDNLGNTESLKSLSFSVDAAPPLTQISFTGPYFMQSVNSGAVPPEAEVFIARETRIVLTAHDPVVAETASGVGEIRYRIDGGAWLAYSQSLAILSGGLHTLEWYAKDRLGLEEAVHSLRIAVDVAAPISSLSIGEPKFLALGLDFVTPQTPIALSAIDLPNSGIAVGVQGISYRIDAGAELLYTASFTLAQGTHSIEFWAYDRAGNVEYRQSRLLTSTLLQTAALTGVDGITGSGTAQVTGKLLSNGRVALSGSVRVLGDAAGSPVALTGNASVSGIVSQNGAGTLSEPIDLALAEQLASAASSNALIPAAFLKNDVLVVTGNKTLLLATGTYVLKGLTLSGGASLDVAGPVRLFLDGPMQVNGGAKLNAGGTAASLVLFAKSGSIALSGGAQAVGLFYAPRSSLGISGNARIGGALFAKSVAITGDSNVISTGEVLPPESIASGGAPGKGGKTADFDAGTVPGHSSLLAAADPAFVLRDLYAFPNPAVGGAKPVIHAAVGIADRVLVKIFDVSGRQTQEATLDGSPQIVDDGSGPKYAYEYTWDGHIPSGVYFYTIEAEKSGQKIRKAGKLAVVR